MNKRFVAIIMATLILTGIITTFNLGAVEVEARELWQDAGNAAGNVIARQIREDPKAFDIASFNGDVIDISTIAMTFDIEPTFAQNTGIQSFDYPGGTSGNGWSMTLGDQSELPAKDPFSKRGVVINLEHGAEVMLTGAMSHVSVVLNGVTATLILNNATLGHDEHGMSYYSPIMVMGNAMLNLIIADDQESNLIGAEARCPELDCIFYTQLNGEYASGLIQGTTSNSHVRIVGGRKGTGILTANTNGGIIVPYRNGCAQAPCTTPGCTNVWFDGEIGNITLERFTLVNRSDTVIDSTHLTWDPRALVGGNWGCDAGNISIMNCIVDMQKRAVRGSAFIGGGYDSDVGTIVLQDSVFMFRTLQEDTQYMANAAVIGGGVSSSVGNIIVDNCEFDTSCWAAQTIGAGGYDFGHPPEEYYPGKPIGNIRVNNSYFRQGLMASGGIVPGPFGIAGAGIDGANCGDITLEGCVIEIETLDLFGSDGRPVIGAGKAAGCGDITITDTRINGLTSHSFHNAFIGSGGIVNPARGDGIDDNYAGDIVITDSMINVQHHPGGTVHYPAIIGAGSTAVGNITIRGSLLEFGSESWGLQNTLIGGGGNGGTGPGAPCGVITISDSKIVGYDFGWQGSGAMIGGGVGWGATFRGIDITDSDLEMYIGRFRNGAVIGSGSMIDSGGWSLTDNGGISLLRTNLTVGEFDTGTAPQLGGSIVGGGTNAGTIAYIRIEDSNISADFPSFGTGAWRTLSASIGSGTGLIGVGHGWGTWHDAVGDIDIISSDILIKYNSPGKTDVHNNAAIIGTGWNSRVGNVTIDDTTLDIQVLGGAQDIGRMNTIIGTSSNPSAAIGLISIIDSEVNIDVEAISRGGGSVIGAGVSEYAGTTIKPDILIDRSKLTARRNVTGSGAFGAVIGAGHSHAPAGSIVIRDSELDLEQFGTITAFNPEGGSLAGAVIGGGTVNSMVDSIFIENSRIRAVNGENAFHNASAIGGGYGYSGVNEIRIIGSKLSAEGSKNSNGWPGAAAIGNGDRNFNVADIYISGGTIVTESGLNAPGIGGSGLSEIQWAETVGRWATNVVIDGGSVYAPQGIVNGLWSELTPPQNRNGENVYMINLDINPIQSAGAAVDSVAMTGAAYYDVYNTETLSGGRLYFWVPENIALEVPLYMEGDPEVWVLNTIDETTDHRADNLSRGTLVRRDIPTNRDIAFTDLTANGSESHTTDAVWVTLQPGVPGLTIDNFVVSGASLIVNVTDVYGDLGVVYKIDVVDLDGTGTITVTIADGYHNYMPDTRSVDVFIPEKKLIEYKAEQIGGGNGSDTTAIDLIFTEPVAGLLRENMVVTDGTGSIIAGCLEQKEPDTYRLHVQQVTHPGTVIVQVINRGDIDTNPTPVSVYKQDKTEVSFEARAEENNRGETTRINIEFDKPVYDLTRSDIIIEDMTGAIRAGRLTGRGRHWVLEVDEVTREGIIRVTVLDFSSFVVNPSSRVVGVRKMIPFEAIIKERKANKHVKVEDASPETDVTCSAGCLIVCVDKCSGGRAGTCSSGASCVNSFVDVKESDWFYQAAVCLFCADIVLGTGDNPRKFNPNLSFTRGMMATIMYRAAGKPSIPTGVKRYLDVETGKWYSDAIAWARAAKVMIGFNGNVFKPYEPMTREMMSRMLINFQKYVGIMLPDNPAANLPRDIDKVAGWAQKHTEILAKQGVLLMYTDGTYRPHDVCSRADSCAMLYKVLQAFVGTPQHESWEIFMSDIIQ